MYLNFIIAIKRTQVLIFCPSSVLKSSQFRCFSFLRPHTYIFQSLPNPFYFFSKISPLRTKEYILVYSKLFYIMLLPPQRGFSKVSPTSLDQSKRRTLQLYYGFSTNSRTLGAAAPTQKLLLVPSYNSNILGRPAFTHIHQ